MATKKKITEVKKSAKAKKPVKKAKAPPRKPVRESPPEPERIDIELVATVIGTRENTTREKQAKALGVTDRTLRRWLADNPGILERALEKRREASAGTMITAYRRLDGIIAKGNPKNCIAAIKLLAQLRGEFVEKRELSGGLTFNDPRLDALMDSLDEDSLRRLVFGGAGSSSTGGGCEASPANG